MSLQGGGDVCIPVYKYYVHLSISYFLCTSLIPGVHGCDSSVLRKLFLKDDCEDEYPLILYQNQSHADAFSVLWGMSPDLPKESVLSPTTVLYI